MSITQRVRAALVEPLANAYLELGGASAPSYAHPPVAEIEAMPWSVERPKLAGAHADLVTNAALVFANKLGKPALECAEVIGKWLSLGIVPGYEIAGPGFINLEISRNVFREELETILKAGSGWGKRPAGTGDRVNLEFVSANPTGPVTVASGRNAILGDSLARILESQGHRVTREYYVNDRGNQIRNLVDSVLGKPKGEYSGPYIDELTMWLDKFSAGFDTRSEESQGQVCVYRMLNGIPKSTILPGIRPSLAALGVYFDVWFSESSLYSSGTFHDTVLRLEELKRLENKSQAIVYKAPHIQDGERVFRKSDGDWTYFASDAAYCADKIARGYDRLILVVGADHHGYVPWIDDALKTLGFAGKFDVLLYQLVTILKNGLPVKMSKRTGNIVTIDEVMDEIDEAAGHKGAGADALRFIFLMRNSNSTVEFDVDQAQKRSLDNPVFYVQYAYARLCGIQRKAADLGLKASAHALSGFKLKSERSIIQRLGEFPEVVEKAASFLEPHRIVGYLYELAKEFHSYYAETRNDPILPSESVLANANWRETADMVRIEARLAWVEAIRVVCKSALDLIGVSAPERMD